MRAPPRIPRFLALAALTAAALVPAQAGASDGAVPDLAGSFQSGSGGWTSTSACAPLCSVTNTVDPGPGAGDPGSATIVYTTLAGLLGGLASGTSTWTSPSFSWTGAAPGSAAVSFARKATIADLLSVGGSASSKLQLDDQTAATVTTIAIDGISGASSGFVTRTVSLDPSLLKAGHSYRLRLTTNLAAASVLSGIRVSYDDIVLNATAAATGNGGDGGTGNTGNTGNTGGSDPANAPPAAPGAQSTVRLKAPAGVRFTRGQTFTVRVRATRGGKAAGHLMITLHVAGTTRRLSTGRDGTAAFRLVLRTRAAARITFRTGKAVATTSARPR